MATAVSVPHVDWTTFYETIDWQQGEHVAILGRTGSGKTYLAKELITIRSGYIVAFGVKPKDDTLSELIKGEGFTRIYKWPPKTRDMRKVALWPRVRSSDDITRLAPVFKDALDSIFSSLAWCVYLDEARYITERLGLRQELVDMWTLGRSGKLSVVGCSQRPTWVPPEMYTQATHVFLFRQNGKDDLERLRSIDVGAGDTVREIVAGLPRHHCLYVNTVTGELATTIVER